MTESNSGAVPHEFAGQDFITPATSGLEYLDEHQRPEADATATTPETHSVVQLALRDAVRRLRIVDLQDGEVDPELRDSVDRRSSV